MSNHSRREMRMNSAAALDLLKKAEKAVRMGDPAARVGEQLGGAFDILELAVTAWVETARDEGMSWRRIGETLGVTKQAAQQKYGHKATVPLLDEDPEA